MKVHMVTYERLYNLGNYENERFTATVEVGPDLSSTAVDAAYELAQATVERAKQRADQLREAQRVEARCADLIVKLTHIAPQGISMHQRDYAFERLEPTDEGRELLEALTQTEAKRVDVRAACEGKSEALLELALRVARQRVAGPDIEF